VEKMPIEKSEIRTLVPHAGNMCLLDRVLEWDDESIVCTSETHRDPTNPLRRDGLLSVVHAFEYAAQAAAVHGGLLARSAGVSALPHFLAAVRAAHFQVTRLDDIDSRLEVRARRLFGEEGNAIYECQVAAGTVVLADGRLTVMVRKGPT
jgi:predicted hotdog family 3-hydroxylacyl-ACP dehydratase